MSESIVDFMRQRFRDLLTWRDKRPQVMLSEYASGIAQEIHDQRIGGDDIIVMDTSDDFALMALAKAIQIAKPQDRLQLHAIFHFDVDEGNRGRLFGQQINRAAASLRSHDLRLHATSPQLAGRMIATGIELPVTPIPYPTRRSNLRSAVAADGRRLRVVLAGLPRAEKGRGAIASLVAGVADQLHSSAGLCLSMQMNENGWQKMIPESLHDLYRRCLAADRSRSRDSMNSAIDAVPSQPFEIKTSNLDSGVYHGWLDSADIGLFLYEPSRYVARASGVLLEMMTRGVPVIVPADCWLGDFVDQQNQRLGHSQPKCGLVYSNRDEVPSLIRTMQSNYSTYAEAARQAAIEVADQHSGLQTIASMGIATHTAAKSIQGSAAA